jgi:RNA polymerase sigma factor (sigma-70 family)
LSIPGFVVPDSWTEISGKVEGYVRRFFRRRPEVDPADLVQDILLQLLRRLQVPGPSDGDPQLLALVIARRRCIDALRRSYASSRVAGSDALDAIDLAAGSPMADERRERAEIRALLVKVRGHLTPRCRTILDQLLLGWRLADVAKTMGITSGAVRNRWFECRRHIRRLLQEWGIRKETLVG